MRLDRPLPQSADLVDGLDPRKLLFFYEITGQHRPRPAEAVHTVNSYALKKEQKEDCESLTNTGHTLRKLRDINNRLKVNSTAGTNKAGI